MGKVNVVELNVDATVLASGETIPLFNVQMTVFTGLYHRLV